MFSDYDDVVSIDDLMEILDIGRNKAYELLKNGEIQSFKIGKVYKIPKLCIQEYIFSKVNICYERLAGF
jgi:excisionase family DNA binding protein